MIIDTLAIHVERMTWLESLAHQPGQSACVDWPWTLSETGYPDRMAFRGRPRQRPSHIILTLTGHPRPSAQHFALHSCDRRSCLAPWHLRWGTHQENIDDMVQRGRNASVKGERNGRSKLTASDVEQIRTAVASGVSQRAQARAYGVHHSVIQQIIRGEIWASA